VRRRRDDIRSPLQASTCPCPSHAPEALRAKGSAHARAGALLRFGDGGARPTREMIERGSAARARIPAPARRLEGSGPFLERLGARWTRPRRFPRSNGPASSTSSTTTRTLLQHASAQQAPQPHRGLPSSGDLRELEPCRHRPRHRGLPCRRGARRLWRTCSSTQFHAILPRHLSIAEVYATRTPTDTTRCLDACPRPHGPLMAPRPSRWAPGRRARGRTTSRDDRGRGTS
jgi:hypothetical protein